MLTSYKLQKKETTFLGVFHSDSIIMGNLIKTSCFSHWVQSSFNKYIAAQPSYNRSVSLRLGRRKWVMPKLRRSSKPESGRRSPEKQSCLQKAYSWKVNTKNLLMEGWHQVKKFQGGTLRGFTKGSATDYYCKTRKGKYQLNNLANSQHWDQGNLQKRWSWWSRKKSSQDTTKCRNPPGEALKSYSENTGRLSGKYTRLWANQVTSAWDLISKWDSNATQLPKGQDFSWLIGF